MLKRQARSVAWLLRHTASLGNHSGAQVSAISVATSSSEAATFSGRATLLTSATNFVVPRPQQTAVHVHPAARRLTPSEYRRGYSSTASGAGGGSQAAVDLLENSERMRIAHDLGAMKRLRIEGVQVPAARAVLIPFCHVGGEASALFSLHPDAASGGVKAGFPGGARAVDDSAAIATAIREACGQLGTTHEALSVLGLTHDCPDIAARAVVTPVLGYLGEVDVKVLQSKADHPIFSLPLDYLLSPESIDVNEVPGVGPVPVFNSSCKRHPLQIWGLTAQILHVALRTVVGANPAYRDALYGPFMRARRQHAG